MLKTHRGRAVASAIAGLALAGLAPARVDAQAIIKVNDSVNVRVGFLSQTWADFEQNPRQDTSYAQSIFQRRIRLLVSAQVGSKFAFFFQTDNPNLGRTGPNLPGTASFTRALGTGFIMQDAYVEVKPSTTNSFVVEGGLLLIPLCRNCYASAASLLPLDYSSYSFLQSGPTGSTVGRDVGFEGKGTVLEQRLEYRGGIFSGARLFSSTTPTYQTASNSLRGAGHLMYNFLDVEAPGYVLPGTYLGRKKVFNIGAGFDVQGAYKALAADAFLSYPIGANGVTLGTTFIHFDGGNFFAALPRQNTFEVEGGYHFTDSKFTPWAKFETRGINDAFRSATSQNDHRVQVGATYYLMGNNLNMKLAYTHGTFDQYTAFTTAGAATTAPSLTQNGFTFQLQGFYY